MDLGLSGPHFLEHWGVIPLGGIANLIQTTMPEGAANTLTLQQSTDIVAFILWQNFYPMGARELPADVNVLNRITLQTPEEHLRMFVAMMKK